MSLSPVDLHAPRRSTSTESDSVDSLAAAVGDCWIQNPLGSMVSTVPDLPITARSVSGYRIGFDRTFDTLYVKATVTRDNIGVDNMCESLTFPPSDTSYSICLDYLRNSIYEAAPIYKRLASITESLSATEARQTVTDQEAKLLRTVALQALIVYAFVP